MLRELADLRVVVTGSTRGLGRAFAEAFVDAGAAVVVNGTTAASTDAAVDDLRGRGARIVGLAGSVADVEVADALIAACVAEWGGIDVLVNNAGITADRSLVKMTPEEFDAVVAVHLRGTWACSAAAAREMRTGGGGSIVNITSGSGLFGMFGQSNYAAAKAGIIGLSRVMHLELARYGVRINALAPVAATDMTATFDDGTGPAHSVQFPPAAAVAPLVTFLASPAAAEVAGQVLSFDGEVLSVWSHPEPTEVVSRTTWTPGDFASALESAHLQHFHPDRWGTGVVSP